MGFWKGLGDLAKIGINVAAGQAEAERILGMNETVARRQVELAARRHGDMEWASLVVGLDHFARVSYGRKAELAAELASYADSIRVRP
jgi:hypothetical protein